MSRPIISALKDISKDKAKTTLVSMGVDRDLDNINIQNIVPFLQPSVINNHVSKSGLKTAHYFIDFLCILGLHGIFFK